MRTPEKLPGKFIVFEGLDGCGKSTQIKSYASTLKIPHIVTSEPGGTELGMELRRLIKSTQDKFQTDPGSLFYMLMAARRDHTEKVILPALRKGTLVICDRYTDSTLAYQGAGEGMDDRLLTEVLNHASVNVSPSLVVFIDINVSTVKCRISDRYVRDRFDERDGEFFERVRKGYLDQYERHLSDEPWCGKFLYVLRSAMVKVSGGHHHKKVESEIKSILDNFLKI